MQKDVQTDTLLFLLFWTDLTRCGPMNYNNYFLSLHKKSILLSKTMDSNLISGKRFLFAYCNTDGVLDEISPEQRTSIIHIIESLLSEGEDEISESLLSGEDANKTK